MGITVVWFGGETQLEGEYLAVRDVLDAMNSRHPAAKYFMARNERGEILKPGLELTNNQVVIVVQRPPVYANG